MVSAMELEIHRLAKLSESKPSVFAPQPGVLCHAKEWGHCRISRSVSERSEFSPGFQSNWTMEQFNFRLDQSGLQHLGEKKEFDWSHDKNGFIGCEIHLKSTNVKISNAVILIGHSVYCNGA